MEGTTRFIQTIQIQKDKIYTDIKPCGSSGSFVEPNPLLDLVESVLRTAIHGEFSHDKGQIGAKFTCLSRSTGVSVDP